MEGTLVSYKMKRENQKLTPYEFVELSEKNEIVKLSEKNDDYVYLFWVVFFLFRIKVM